jgi:D-beta-D-heptose 7-phosphate kinase/D-beta-D-heptose 1-phosphate adenosyltransferase
MKNAHIIPTKIYQLPALLQDVNRWRLKSKTISFTNGCFDILHDGHIASLSQAAAEGDYLIVGLNSDASIKRIKGPKRPINNEQTRALLLASLLMVDAVVIFEEDTPLELVKAIMPDVMVKGGDYTIDQIEGGKEVIANGGRVVINPIVPGFSTTSIIAKMEG